jgi:aminopeptidase-like protein
MSGAGATLFAHVEALYPLCRSITGEGLRRTLRHVAAHVPLALSEVPTGTRVLDWEIPREWNPRAAWIRRLSGETVVDFARHNLHLVQYSRALPERVIPIEELRPHLHSLPAQPDLIPYRTAYYADGWGFCLPHRVLEGMTDPAYRVHIDADLAPGSLTYGECALPGRDSGEVLVSAHSCHPSLANDNLAGVACAVELARWLTGRERRFTWRFLFAPGTIGAIAWLAANPDAARRVRHGLVLTCLGDGAPLTYKASRRGDAAIDRIAAHVLRYEAPPGAPGNRLRPFSPYGYDERQFCSPGFDLPMGCLMRSPHGEYPEYHTSADDLSLVRPEHLARSLAALQAIAEAIEGDEALLNTAPFGEPQLGRRGLYRPVGGAAADMDQMALLWTLNLCDGRHSLLDIAERAGKPFAAVRAAADALRAAGLLVRAEGRVITPGASGAS